MTATDNGNDTTRRTVLKTLGGLLGAIGVGSSAALADTPDSDGNVVGQPDDDDVLSAEDPRQAVTVRGLLIAVDDYRDDEITTEQLLTVIQYFRDKSAITDVIGDYRAGEITEDTLLYIIELWRQG